MNAGAAAIGGLARGYPERIARSRQHEIAVAAHRPRQRAHIAAEGDVVQFERAAARGVMQRDTAGQVEAVDRQRTQIEFSRRCRPVDPAFAHRGRDRAPCR